LTLLEVFLAVAPPESEPHELLRISHVAESKALGRDSDAVLYVSLPPATDAGRMQSQVDKALPPNAAELCRNERFLTDQFGVWTRVQLPVVTLPDAAGGLGAFLCVGGPSGSFSSLNSISCPTQFTQTVRALICNLDPVGAPFVVQAMVEIESEPPVFGAPSAVEAGLTVDSTVGASSRRRGVAIVVFNPNRTTSAVLGSGVAEPP
jgi:hypothetical protein